LPVGLSALDECKKIAVGLILVNGHQPVGRARIDLFITFLMSMNDSSAGSAIGAE